MKATVIIRTAKQEYPCSSCGGTINRWDKHARVRVEKTVYEGGEEKKQKLNYSIHPTEECARKIDNDYVRGKAFDALGIENATAKGKPLGRSPSRKEPKPEKTDEKPKRGKRVCGLNLIRIVQKRGLVIPWRYVKETGLDGVVIVGIKAGELSLRQPNEEEALEFFGIKRSKNERGEDS